jgi:nitrite reductase/ring-hydroxylating ferredoxin subunit
MQGEWTLPVPKGWHRVADARSLAPGDVRPGRVDGHELVVYRTESGEARVAGAWCPHLGAHLGHCGRVEAEQLRCTFHGLRFDGAGSCDATGYGTKPPPSARLKPWATREAYGQIFAWYDPAGTQPDWSLPTLDEAGWTSWRSTSWRLPTHPQDIAENSVDLGHFGWVHGYHAVRELRTPEAEGPCLKVWYDFERPLPGLTLRGAPRLKIEIAGEVWGLGCTIVDVRIRGHQHPRRRLAAALLDAAPLGARASRRARRDRALRPRRRAGLRLLEEQALRAAPRAGRRRWAHRALPALGTPVLCGGGGRRGAPRATCPRRPRPRARHGDLTAPGALTAGAT